MISEESDPDAATFIVKASERTTHAAEMIWTAVRGVNAKQDNEHQFTIGPLRVEPFDS